MLAVASMYAQTMGVESLLWDKSSFFTYVFELKLNRLTRPHNLHVAQELTGLSVILKAKALQKKDSRKCNNDIFK